MWSSTGTARAMNCPSTPAARASVELSKLGVRWTGGSRASASGCGGPRASRWALLIACAGAMSGCATRLGGLEGQEQKPVGQESRGGESSAPESSPPAVVDASQPPQPGDTSDASQPTSTEPTVDAGEQTSEDASVAPPPCPDGELNGDGFCVPVTRCAPGTFVSELDGAEVCFPCESGQFSSEYDAEQCQAWRDCEVGQYVSEPGSAVEDRSCAACPDGETTTTENAGECTGPSDCIAGTYKSDGGCAPCSPGTYCSGKTDVEVPCDATSWDNDADPATPCEAKTDCGVGQFVVADGDATADRSCDFCADETFSMEINAAQCDAWSECAAGTYVGLQGTSSTDRDCEECSAGQYTAVSNESACQVWTTCVAPLQFVAVEPSSALDRSCDECPAGYTTSADDAAECEDNLVTNYDFESATTGWESWIGAVSTSTARAYNGTHSLLVTGSSTGPAATNLDSVVVAGATYDVIFWVDVGKVSTAQVNLTRELNCGGNVTYERLANDPAVANGVWTRLSGSFTVPANCSAPKLKVYAEGTGSNIDLYVDAVSVTRAP